MAPAGTLPHHAPPPPLPTTRTPRRQERPPAARPPLPDLWPQNIIQESSAPSPPGVRGQERHTQKQEELEGPCRPESGASLTQITTWSLPSQPAASWGPQGLSFPAPRTRGCLQVPGGSGQGEPGLSQGARAPGRPRSTGGAAGAAGGRGFNPRGVRRRADRPGPRCPSGGPVSQARVRGRKEARTGR